MGFEGTEGGIWILSDAPNAQTMRPSVDSLRRDTTQHDSTLLLTSGGDFEFGADGGLSTGGENATGAKADDVGEWRVDWQVEAGR